MASNNDLLSDLPNLDIYRDYPLASLTSWRIGGSAEQFFQPRNISDLALYIKTIPSNHPRTWLGLGSNLLIRDGGVKGLVICTRSLNRLYQVDARTVYADAGVTCAKFARFCCQHGFEEGAFFAGIPGTIGGALAMNAGAFGSETWQWVERVQVMAATGTFVEREVAEYQIGYRSVKPANSIGATFEQEAFLGGYFCFPGQKMQQGMYAIKEFLRKRGQTQPIGTLNCGSVFRNPPGDHAARLIEAVGLKGFSIGQASISQKHANFIINEGDARSDDIEQLMALIQKTVLEAYQIVLQPEVRIIGIKK